MNNHVENHGDNDAWKEPAIRTADPIPLWSVSSLWKRVIAWGRSRATSAYGIIWGDAGQDKQGGI